MAGMSEKYKSSYKMSELKSFIGNSLEIVGLQDFYESKGTYYEFSVNGGFIIPNDVQIPLLDEIYASIPEVLALHYSVVWERLNALFTKGLDASSSKRVKFLFYYNSGKSYHPHDKVINEDGSFNVSLELNVAYDLYIFDKNSNLNKIIKGIPHFAIPIVLKLIGKWLSYSKENVNK
ncbi:MAG: hypothetical protein QXS19_07130 [Candidatus Methanomethylicia archaeon]